MLLPRLGPGTYGESFVGFMLLLDLAGVALLALLGRRSGNYTGVWVWLLGMPLLGTFSVLRFDLAPAVIGVAALVIIHRRPNWFGVMAGLGASIKVWPIVLLFGEWDRRRLIHAVAAALGTIALVVVISTLAFGDSTSFLSEQSGRGLQEEAVATVPWHVQAVLTGEAPAREIRSGAWEIATPAADTVASLLTWLTIAALGAAAAWWWYRARAIRAGQVHLADSAVSRDFVFTIVLLLVVTSRVLSPQFMVWLLGLSAVVLTAGSTRLARPAWLVLGATVLSTSLFKSPENIVIRDLALLAATVDAAIAMIGMLRGPLARRERLHPRHYSPRMESAEWNHWWEAGGRRKLRTLLMTHWDPIGVNGIPQARDEYDRYLDPLANLLRGGADTDKVAGYLADVERGQMELPASRDQLLDVANQAIDWYTAEMQRREGRGVSR